jgi:hypothetical protein
LAGERVSPQPSSGAGWHDPLGRLATEEPVHRADGSLHRPAAGVPA